MNKAASLLFPTSFQMFWPFMYSYLDCVRQRNIVKLARPQEIITSLHLSEKQCLGCILKIALL